MYENLKVGSRKDLLKWKRFIVKVLKNYLFFFVRVFVCLTKNHEPLLRFVFN